MISTVLLALAAVSQPHRVDDATLKPLISWIRPTTLIAGRSAKGPQLALRTPDPTAKWSLVTPPKGLSISTDGTLNWLAPEKGRYFVRVKVESGSTTDEAEWWVQVVAPAFSDATVVSSRYVDFVCSTAYASWFRQHDAGVLVDRWYQWIRDQVGQDLCDGRQSVMFVPSMEGGGLSGNPVTSGPIWWGEDSVDHWRLGCFYHEVGHNFHGQMYVFEEFPGGGGLIDKYFHHAMELSQAAFWNQVRRSPSSYTRSGESSLRAYLGRDQADYSRRFGDYQKWLEQDGNALNYQGDHYGAWAGVVRLYAAKYGEEPLVKSLRAFRRDAIPIGLLSNASSDAQRFTLMINVMSNAANHDLRSTFRGYGFPIDDRFYDSIDRTIKAAIDQLPPPDISGWKKCPLNGHYYRLTPWQMPWDQAERTARVVGGHLATIRSKAEQRWLAKSFQGHYPLWIGASDRARENEWIWASGEPFSASFWAAGEPNGGRQENCAAQYASISGGEDGKWIDGQESSRFLGIMERTDAPSASDDLVAAEVISRP